MALKKYIWSAKESMLNIGIKQQKPGELYPKLNDPQDILAAARKKRREKPGRS